MSEGEGGVRSIGAATVAPAGQFTVQAIDWRWSRITHTPCGSTVRFVNATRDRVEHYCRLHRCGGRDWTGA